MHSVIILLFTLSFYVKDIGAQDNCKKYCNKDCSDYFNNNPSPPYPGQGNHNSEFSECVRANIDCDCGSGLPSTTILIIVVVVVVVIGAASCARAGKCLRIPANHDRNEPIEPNVTVAASQTSAPPAIYHIPVQVERYNPDFPDFPNTNNDAQLPGYEQPPSYNEVLSYK